MSYFKALAAAATEEADGIIEHQRQQIAAQRKRIEDLEGALMVIRKIADENLIGGTYKQIDAALKEIRQ